MSDETLSGLLEARFGRRFEVPPEIDGDPALCGIAGHRTHRRFRDEPVPDALLDTLLGCAFSAPSKSDLQQSCVVRVADRPRRAAIEALIPSMPWIARAPELLVFCGDNRRIRRICNLRGHVFGNDHLDSFFNAAVDAALVLMSFVHAAEAAGLGCCPLSAVRNHAGHVAGVLALPAYVFPVAGLVLGYPAEARRIVPRLPLDLLVHRDVYDDEDDFERSVDAYDRRRDAVLPIAPAARRDPARFGEVDLYGWSEDKARQVEGSDDRAGFGAFVRAQGFSLE